MRSNEKQAFKRYIDEHKEVKSITEMATELGISWNWVSIYLKKIGFQVKHGRPKKQIDRAGHRPKDIFAIQWADEIDLQWHEKHEWEGIMKSLKNNQAIQSNALAVWKVKEFHYKAA